MMTASGANSQSSDSSKVWIYRLDAIATLAKAHEAKLLSEKITLLDNHITLLNSRIIEMEGIVKAYELTDGFKDSLINNYRAEIEVMKEQRKVFEQAIADTKKEVRRYKRKLFFRTAGGVMITGVLAYLYFTK